MKRALTFLLFIALLSACGRVGEPVRAPIAVTAEEPEVPPAESEPAQDEEDEETAP